MAGQAPSWCSLDLGLGPPGGEIALVHVARPPAAPSAPALFRPEPGAGGLGRQRPRLGSKRPRGRPSTGIPRPGLSRSAAQRACQGQQEEARRLSSRICPCPTPTDAPIEDPFKPLRCPHTTGLVLFAAQHNPQRRCCCAISGTSWRRKVEISLLIAWLLLALQTNETKVEGGRRVLGRLNAVV